MKGIILAAGKGTRLHPITLATNKILLPVYSKPMIYYPLSTLMLAEITDILIITSPEDLERFKLLLDDGSHLGIRITYAVQHIRRGIADAFIIGEEFIGKDNVFLILGDNIVYGSGIETILQDSVRYIERNEGAVIFGKYVSDPERYGVIRFDDGGNVVEIIEKPREPPSNYAVTGMYIYDNKVIEIAKSLQPSERGELEITDVNNTYLREGKLRVVTLPYGTAWFDAGTIDSLFDASAYVAAVERRQGILIGSPEIVAFQKGWINEDEFRRLAEKYQKTSYGKYLVRFLESREIV